MNNGDWRLEIGSLKFEVEDVKRCPQCKRQPRQALKLIHMLHLRGEIAAEGEEGGGKRSR